MLIRHFFIHKKACGILPKAFCPVLVMRDLYGRDALRGKEFYLAFAVAKRAAFCLGQTFL